MVSFHAAAPEITTLGCEIFKVIWRKRQTKQHSDRNILRIINSTKEDQFCTSTASDGSHVALSQRLLSLFTPAFQRLFTASRVLYFTHVVDGTYTQGDVVHPVGLLAQKCAAGADYNLDSGRIKCRGQNLTVPPFRLLSIFRILSSDRS